MVDKLVRKKARKGTKMKKKARKRKKMKEKWILFFCMELAKPCIPACALFWNINKNMFSFFIHKQTHSNTQRSARSNHVVYVSMIGYGKFLPLHLNYVFGLRNLNFTYMKEQQISCFCNTLVYDTLYVSLYNFESISFHKILIIKSLFFMFWMTMLKSGTIGSILIKLKFSHVNSSALLLFLPRAFYYLNF